MNEPLAKQYDSLYAAEGYYFGEGEPLLVVKKLPPLLKSGRVLDVGGGEGRNALYLAMQEFAVTVLDISTVGLEKVSQVAKQKNIKLTTQLGDVREVTLKESFDAVLVTFVLHHLDSKDALAVIKKVQAHTNPSGIHIIVTFMNQGELYERNKHTNRFYCSATQLEDLYRGWEILELRSQETTTMARHKDGHRLKNHMLVLMARRSINTF